MFIPGELYYLKQLNYIWRIQLNRNELFCLSKVYEKYPIKFNINLQLNEIIMLLKSTPDDNQYVFLFGNKTLKLRLDSIKYFYGDWKRI
jgi:hypothetical protein